MEIGVCKGKKLYDKRDDIAKKDQLRDVEREFKERLQKLGYKKRNNVFLGTVHSFCVSEILGNFAELYDCGIPMPIKIVPDKIKKELFSQIISVQIFLSAIRLASFNSTSKIVFAN